MIGVGCCVAGGVPGGVEFARLRSRGCGGDGHGASVIAETRDDRDGGIHRDNGCAVTLAVDGRWDRLVAESKSGRGGGDQRLARERHAQRAGFGGDGRIDGGGEMEDETWRIVAGKRGGEMGGDAADEEASGIFVQRDGAA